MSAAFKKVIVIGLDGLEPAIVDAMLGAGELPNLARLRASGGYSRIATTTPAQTPVAWSSFATGTNPGGHGIFDFLRRDPKTYLPDLGLNRYEQKSAFHAPSVVNLRRGTPVWDVLTSAGIPSTIIRCPCTYPPDAIDGRMLSGMGVPDLRGGMGTGSFYTTDTAASARESEQLIILRGAASTHRTHLIGPRNPRGGGDFTVPLTFEVDAARERALIRSDGRPHALEVRQGEWSDWLRVKFKSGLLTSIAGIVRFLLVRTAPDLELYASPVNFDPRAPLFPISHPTRYAGELASALGGDFYTTGMVEDHSGLSNERFDEGVFLSQCDDALREREAMLTHELARFREGLLFCLFDTPDRLQHMFWRFREPTHPANREPAERCDEMARVIEEHYTKCDAIVGRALEAVDSTTLCLVLSDHGFHSFQRGMHLNSWLHQQGLLVLKPGVRADSDAGDFLRLVDWGRTTAYALGLGSIYLNVQGREGEGIVAPNALDDTAAQIAQSITGLVDPVRAQVAVRGARTRAQVYSGPFAAESPDVMVDFNAGYRVSWSTALGGMGHGLFEDNVKRWGGDHVIDPLLVPGVLFMNRPFDGSAARLTDMAPTILAALGIVAPDAMEGVNLLTSG